MKKLILAAIVVLTASFTSCTKDNNVKPATLIKAKILADDGNKMDIGQADGNKMDIGQADIK